MADDLARAVGAGASIDIKVGGQEKTYELSPVGLASLQQLQREALKAFKRQYLETYVENTDLLGNGTAENLVREKLDEVAKWDIGHLPKMKAFSVDHLEIKGSLADELLNRYGEIATDVGAAKRLLATALDMEDIKPAQVKEWCGKAPRSGQVPYDSWWVTGTYDGMMALIWVSVKKKHPDFAKAELQDWPSTKIMEAARIVEQLTTPQVGNT